MGSGASSLPPSALASGGCCDKEPGVGGLGQKCVLAVL